MRVGSLNGPSQSSSYSLGHVKFWKAINFKQEAASVLFAITPPQGTTLNSVKHLKCLSKLVVIFPIMGKCLYFYMVITEEKTEFGILVRWWLWHNPLEKIPFLRTVVEWRTVSVKLAGANGRPADRTKSRRAQERMFLTKTKAAVTAVRGWKRSQRSRMWESPLVSQSSAIKIRLTSLFSGGWGLCKFSLPHLSQLRKLQCDLEELNALWHSVSCENIASSLKWEKNYCFTSQRVRFKKNCPPETYLVVSIIRWTTLFNTIKRTMIYMLSFINKETEANRK